jgi:hypothetical protein
VCVCVFVCARMRMRVCVRLQVNSSSGMPISENRLRNPSLVRCTCEFAGE